MKLIHLFTIITAVSLFSLPCGAQNQGINYSPAALESNSQNAISKSLTVHPGDGNIQSTQSLWVNYSVIADSLGGKNSSYWYQFLFPDSNVRVCPSSCYNAWVSLIGNVLDPFAPALQQYYGMAWNEFTSFTVDSMSIGYMYKRNHVSSVDDTLIITLYNDLVSNDLPDFTFNNRAWEINFGVDTLVDTLAWKQILYNYSLNVPYASNPVITKVPLNISDTTMGSFYYYKDFKINSLPVPAGKHVVAATVEFKPGFTHTNNEIITSTKNNFMFLSLERNGTNTFPKYVPHDRNSSSIATNYERYNTPLAWSGGGNMVPSWAFNQAFGSEDHLISYKLTSMDVGINEMTDDLKGIKLYQNVPNPSSANSTILRYEIEKQEDVSLTIRDITGRNLMSINEARQEAGSHSVFVDVSKLSGGIYFYSLHANGITLTRQMVIAE